MYKIDSDMNISIVRGDYVCFKLELVDEEGKPYTPQQSDKIRFAVAEEYGQTRKTDCLIYKDIDVETLEIEILPTDTKRLGFGEYKYDVEFTDGFGHPDTILKGKFVVDTEVY